MKKICLVGTAPSVHQAPFTANSDWDIWACSPGVWALQPQKLDQYFELHRWEPGQAWMSHEYCQFLMDFPGKVWVSEQVPGMRNGHVVPVDKLVDKYGPYFFTSSLAWMFALAIEEKPDKIALFGVDMAAEGEYGYQRAGCQYFAQLARSLGIEVGVPPESDLLRPAPLYGVSELSHAHIRMTARRRELQARHDAIELEMRQKSEEFMFLKGAIDNLNWHQNTWIGDKDSLGKGFVEPPYVKILEEFGAPGPEVVVSEPVSTVHSMEIVHPPLVSDIDLRGPDKPESNVPESEAEPEVGESPKAQKPKRQIPRRNR